MSNAKIEADNFEITCPCLPLFTLVIKIDKNHFVHLCYEDVFVDGKDPIDFSDLILISNLISKTKDNRFHSHLFSRFLMPLFHLKITCWQCFKKL